MTLIDKAEALEAVHEADSLELAQHGTSRIADRIAALPARGVAVKQLQWKQAGGDIKAGDGFSAWPDLLGAPITIYRKHDGWWLSSDCKTHPTLDAAKAAAQADYEARILAALAPTDAAHVNETPKSEHDGADVLTAAQAREVALDAIKMGFLSAAPGEWRVSDIERVTEAILRALEQEGR